MLLAGTLVSMANESNSNPIKTCKFVCCCFSPVFQLSTGTPREMHIMIKFSRLLLHRVELGGPKTGNYLN